jgi:phosphatidylglycerophosphate synthase
MSLARLAAVVPLWLLALGGHARWLALLLFLAGISDAIDGFLARRSGAADVRGSRIDSLADNLILPSAIVWLLMLRWPVVAANLWLVVGCACTYLASLTVGLLRFHRLGDLHLWSSKLAGVLLYLLAINILVLPEHSTALLYVAGTAFFVSSAETLVVQLTASSPEPGLRSIVQRWQRKVPRGDSLHPDHLDGRSGPFPTPDAVAPKVREPARR